jgi:flavorubredoxin
MKVFILYDSKYGNTKTAAENVLESLKQVEDIEVAISCVRDIDPHNVINYDALILGAPNHMASPSRAMKNFVDKLAKLNVSAKSVAVFGTYSGRVRLTDRAVKKMEKIVEKTLPSLKLLPPSLSVRVKGVTGPVADGELSKCQEFGKRIEKQLNH